MRLPQAAFQQTRFYTKLLHGIGAANGSQQFAKLVRIGDQLDLLADLLPAGGDLRRNRRSRMYPLRPKALINKPVVEARDLHTGHSYFRSVQQLAAT
ncbi:hypothetical protein D3C73_1504250 [compost metagenome]